MPADRS